MKKIICLLLFFFLFFFSFSNAFAADNFATYYNVRYDVLENETTKVTIGVELKNKTSDYYASSYSVQTGFEDIKNINISDSRGKLNFDAEKTEKGVLISFKFLDRVVGIDNIQKFSLSFDTREIAKSSGSVWEVNIPGISNQEDYAGFNVLVVVPNSFGQAVFIKPAVKNLKSIGNTLSFSKNDLGKSGISIAYGVNQSYDFDLKYHLYNNNLFPVTTEIALPPNTNYQEIQISDITPRPLDVEIDRDGNWLAKYRLSPSQKVKISVLGFALVSYKPNRENLSEEQRKLYLKPQEFWEVNNPEIKVLAKRLKTPEEIYKYVVKNLKYDSNRVKNEQVRAGALGVLVNKNSAVCLEFTDFFVTLARAAGIPARSVEGYANTSNSSERPLSFKDVLHAWPEFYDEDKKAWIMVDPTWENTTKGIDYFNVFDFDHLAFVIKGQDSKFPVSVGGYKFPGQVDTQDVTVKLTKSFSKFTPALTASTDFSDNYYGGFPVEGKVIVVNNSGVLSPNQTVSVLSKTFVPNSQNLYLSKIPPYGKEELGVKFTSFPFLTNEADIIKISINGKTIEREISVSPIYKSFYFYFLLGGLLIGILITVLSFFAYRSRRLHIP